MVGYPTGHAGTITWGSDGTTACTFNTDSAVVITSGAGSGTNCVEYVKHTPTYTLQLTPSNGTDSAALQTCACYEYARHKVTQATNWMMINTDYKGGTWTCPAWPDTNVWYSHGNTCTGGWCQAVTYEVLPLTPGDRLREILRSRHAPAIGGNQKPLLPAVDPRELRARETLCMLLGADKYRRFQTRGFVAIRAKSGLIYRLFPGYRQVEVYRAGVLIEKLCIVLRGDFPPTDWLIMRYLLVVNDEADFRKRANLNTIGAHARAEPAAIDQRPLAEIFAELRKTHSPRAQAASTWHSTI